MADTIGELYEKYTSSVEQAVEDDRYFQYLFEMVQAGDNTLEQKKRILHKVVDEQWLTVIEDGIEAIFNIVDKPRRFIKSSETEDCQLPFYDVESKPGRGGSGRGRRFCYG